MSSQAVHALVGLFVALSTVLVVVGFVTVLFLNPIWIGFEQGRSDAATWTGWTSQQVTDVTNAVLHDLVIGPADFAVTIDGRPVFDDREREHERDVRRALLGFVGAAFAGAVILVATRLWSRGAAWFWRSVAAGAAVLGSSVVVLGGFFAFSFDTAFELFHRLFFAGGSYSFDPATERLVQLFPEQLWYETSIALGIVLLVASLAVVWLALRRAMASEAALAIPAIP